MVFNSLANGTTGFMCVGTIREFAVLGELKYLTEVACQLLKTTDLPINNIATDIGFNSSKYFSTAFKQAMGVSPREYRNNK